MAKGNKSGNAAKQRTNAPWRNRIIAHTEEDPAQLLANPLNFRRHPNKQRDALRGSINELGWLKPVLVNKTTGNVIDGHARCEEALTAGGTVPVDWVELTPAEERLALAVLDPISEMAEPDDEALKALLADVTTNDPGLKALLDKLGDIQEPDEHDDTVTAGDIAGFRAATSMEQFAPTDAEREIIGNRRIVIEYSGGKDSSAAALWARQFYPDTPTTLLYIDLGSEYPTMPQHLITVAEWYGEKAKLEVRRTPGLYYLLAEKGWPNALFPWCHEVLHEAIDGYLREFKPDEVICMCGGRQAEKSRTGHTNHSRFLTVDRMEEYTYFQPLYFSEKSICEKVIAESGMPLWEGYGRGLCRTACRICPGQRTEAYSAIRANFPDTWSELMWMEKRLGPGAWQSQGDKDFTALADAGEKRFRDGQKDK